MALAAKSTSMMKALTMWSGKSAMFAPLRCFCTGASDLVTGTCKWFDVQKGFGFITIDNEERDVSRAGGRRARHAWHASTAGGLARSGATACAEPSPGRDLPGLLLRRSQVFVPQRNIRVDGFRSLAEGEPVEFEIREDSRSGKVHASRRQLFRLPALPARITSLTWRPVSAATSRS